MARKILLILLLMAIGEGASARSALTRMFESLGDRSNTSRPGSYQDQAAGHYAGGGFMMRVKDQTYKPLQVSLPHVGAGCRGIDAYFGSMSFMRGDQLVGMLKNMAAQGVTYGFQLGLKTMAPQVENLMSQLRKVALDMNNFQINECRSVQQLYAAALPKGTAAMEHVCTDVKSEGRREDWFGAKKACRDHRAVQAAVEAERAKPANKHMLMGEYNLVWMALKEIEGIRESRGFMEFVMTATGTLISKKEGDRYRVHYIHGKAMDHTFRAAHLKGGKTTYLHCDETSKCLSPREQEAVFLGAGTRDETKTALLQRIYDQIYALRQKYIEGLAFSPEEVQFLNDTVGVPLYRFIQVSAAVGSLHIMDEVLEFIALNLLYEQFERLISKVLKDIETLKGVQVEDSQIENFRRNLLRTRAELHGLMGSASKGASFHMTQMIKGYEQELMARKGSK